jgi:hypothetical protein
VTVSITSGVSALTLTVDSTTPSVGQIEVFYLTYTGPGTIQWYNVTTGDGHSFQGPYTFWSYNYPAAGVYQATGRVGLADGTTMTSNTLIITVSGSSSDNLNLTVDNATVSLSDQAVFRLSYIGSGVVVDTTFYYGDGNSYDYGYGIPIRPIFHAYSYTGVYQVKASAKLDSGAIIWSNIVTVTVGGTEGFDVLSITAVPNPTSTGGTTFTATYNGSTTILLYTWASGDGSGTSTLSNVWLHIYSSNGSYPASVMVTFSTGANRTATVTVTVAIPGGGGTGGTGGTGGSTTDVGQMLTDTIGIGGDWLLLIVATFVLIFMLRGSQYSGIASFAIVGAVAFALFGLTMIAFEILWFMIAAVMGFAQSGHTSGGGGFG